jgi:hypothetical protein
VRSDSFIRAVSTDVLSKAASQGQQPHVTYFKTFVVTPKPVRRVPLGIRLALLCPAFSCPHYMTCVSTCQHMSAALTYWVLEVSCLTCLCEHSWNLTQQTQQFLVRFSPEEKFQIEYFIHKTILSATSNTRYSLLHRALLTYPRPSQQTCPVVAHLTFPDTKKHYISSICTYNFVVARRARSSVSAAGRAEVAGDSVNVFTFVMEKTARTQSESWWQLAWRSHWLLGFKLGLDDELEGRGLGNHDVFCCQSAVPGRARPVLRGSATYTQHDPPRPSQRTTKAGNRGKVPIVSNETLPVPRDLCWSVWPCYRNINITQAFSIFSSATLRIPAYIALGW